MTIVPIVSTTQRHHLAVENDGRGLASVEVLHLSPLATGREAIRVIVTTDEPEYVNVELVVKAS